jgi:hypothetical protein
MEGLEDENLEEVMNENENEELARNVVEGKIRENTRKTYRNRIYALTSWVRESYPDGFDFDSDCIKLL